MEAAEAEARAVEMVARALGQEYNTAYLVQMVPVTAALQFLAPIIVMVVQKTLV